MTTKKQTSPTPVPAENKEQQSVQDLVRINLNVPASVRKKWKEAALREDVTLSELIIKAMSKHSNE